MVVAVVAIAIAVTMILLIPSMRAMVSLLSGSEHDIWLFYSLKLAGLCAMVCGGSN